jgi:hypothetical protein
MPELSLHHIDQISRDISRQEITFSHLLEDLIDHVCCDVEDEMRKGMSFTDAYQRVKQKMGSRRLKEIQEETLYAVDTKYRFMKNTMKISGVIGTIMLGFGVMFKIQHFPLAGALMTLGAMLLAFVFLPSALGVLWKETHSRNRLFLFITAFLTGACFIAGTLFKIQHWPGAGYILILGTLSYILLFIPTLMVNRLNDPVNKPKRPVYILGSAGSVLFVVGMLFKIQSSWPHVMWLWPLATLFMIIGIFLLCFLAFPSFTWLTWKLESHISSMFIFLVIGFLLIVIPGTMVTLNLQNSYQTYYYRNNEQQTYMNNYLFRNNRVKASMLDSLRYLKAEQLHDRTRGVLAIISNIQEKMVLESEGKPGKPAVSSDLIYLTEAGKQILYFKLSKPFNTNPPKDFLFPGCSARKELNSSMAEYVNYLTSITPTEDLLKYKNLLNMETFLPAGNPKEGGMSLMSGLHNLEIIKNGLLTVESCVLNEIAKR